MTKRKSEGEDGGLAASGVKHSRKGRRFGDVLQRMYGGEGSLDTSAVSTELRSAYNASVKPLYERAMNDPSGQSLWTSKLQTLAQSPTMQKAIFKAEQRSRDLAATGEAIPVRNPFSRDTAGNLTLNSAETGATPSLAFWDVVKKELDSTVTKLRSKDPGRANEIRALRDELKSHLDEQVPTYQYARGQAAAFFKANDALEAGQKFASQNGASNFSAVSDMVRKLPDHERELFEMGVISEIAHKAINKPEGVDLTASLFGAGTMNKLKAALPKARIDELEHTIRVERAMRRFNQDSATAPAASNRAQEFVNAGLDVASTGFQPVGMIMSALRLGARKMGAGMSCAHVGASSRRLLRRRAAR